ncbi:MAG: hypothetical protein ING75_15225 [Rhodocyclaceae bacterium]|nr:hypothetical protein [Rhodocyclaceae bacterium]
MKFFDRQKPDLLKSGRSTDQLTLYAAVLVFGVSVGSIAFVAHERNRYASLIEARADAKSRSIQIETRTRTSSDLSAKEALRKLEHAMYFAWETAFDAAEDLATAEIEVLSVSPTKSTGSVSIQAQARSTEAMLRFVSSLEDRTGLYGVHLARLEAKTVGSLSLVEFEVLAQLPMHKTLSASRGSR